MLKNCARHLEATYLYELNRHLQTEIDILQLQPLLFSGDGRYQLEVGLARGHSKQLRYLDGCTWHDKCLAALEHLCTRIT